MPSAVHLKDPTPTQHNAAIVQALRRLQIALSLGMIPPAFSRGGELTGLKTGRQNLRID